VCFLLLPLAAAPAWSSENTRRTQADDLGALDSTFGEAGVAVTDLGGFDAATALAVGDRIVSSGTGSTGASIRASAKKGSSSRTSPSSTSRSTSGSTARVASSSW
jgi:hypothetical protein